MFVNACYAKFRQDHNEECRNEELRNDDLRVTGGVCLL